MLLKATVEGLARGFVRVVSGHGPVSLDHRTSARR